MRQPLLTTGRLSLFLLLTGLLPAAASAGESHHSVQIVKVKTGDAEAVEADVSDLALGESRTFTTDSGSTVDILRTANGLEVYVDGELLDTEFGAQDLHERMALIQEELERDCGSEDEETCENHHVYAWSTGDEADADVLVSRKKIEIVCDEAEACDEMVWIQAGEHAGEGHESHQHTIMIIEKEESTRE